MGTKDKRVDAYIAAAPGFARPILKHIRELMHKGCPDVSETIKWSFPHFEHNGILCNMAAFKAHCRWMFWKSDMTRLDWGDGTKIAGPLARITTLSDLPDDTVLLKYIKEAVRLNDGVKRKLPPKTPKKDLAIPTILASALKKNAKAAKTFEAFSYSHKKEYVNWISDAKKDETRQRRLDQTLEWLAQGKSRDWKYQRP